MAASVSRRDFARLFALGGSAALFTDPVWAKQNAQAPAFAPTISGTGEAFWKSVREQFVMPSDLGVLNAANLCPASRPVLEALKRESDSVDRDPSAQNRARLGGEKENLRKALAAFLRVTPEEIVITRNTSEANNMVSSGLDLRQGDEVIVFHDNHPSNLTAWNEKAKRFGFTVIEIPQVNPHPGMEYYVNAYKKSITSNTKILSFTHLTSSVGDLFPAKELCALARENGVMSLVDGAQSFGLLDVNLAEISPDFYTGSAHKWPCGARECGVLYINTRAQKNIWPSIYSAYSGAVGISRTFESFGQRDEATMIAFREALEFQTKVGRAGDREAIARARQSADRRVVEAARREGLDLAESVAQCRRGVVLARLAELAEAWTGAVPEGQDRHGRTRRPGSRRPPRVAALLQHAGRSRSPGERRRAATSRPACN